MNFYQAYVYARGTLKVLKRYTFEIYTKVPYVYTRGSILSSS
jgi:hypothetical protein